MHYISTRGPGELRDFTSVMLAGMAPDGGLYIPQEWPVLDKAQQAALQGKSYAETAYEIIRPFVGQAIDAATLENLLLAAYKGGVFHHPACAPLTQVDSNLWIMELFHGPTLSFKDYALQLLGRLFDYELARRGERLTIVGATSGDTGSAAIEACRHCRNIDIFILYPQGRTSDVQRRQMTTIDAPNVHAIAIEGTFDDCQALVKALFADEQARKDLNLSAVNSINWARIMAQVVYYFAASFALGGPDRPVSVAVPTGNFGNVYAASVAQRMGAPLHKLVIGTNRNDILTRFFETGEMRVDQVTPSLSPSMDIQVSSNFERYLCEILDRDHGRLSTLMSDFAQTRSFRVDEDTLRRAQSAFTARRCSDEDTIAMMAQCYQESGIIIDPHTAVGMHAARAAMQDDDYDARVPMVVLACAHPAKFPEAVEKATGQAPAIPERLAVLLEKPERLAVLPADKEKLKDFIGQCRGV